MSATHNSPYVRAQASVTQVMLKVLLALIPAYAVYVWLFGWAILLQTALAVGTALACEAAILKARGKPLALHLCDLSAVVTAVLIALAFPPIAPWWVVVVGSAFAIVVAKHLYGGLGQNPFNPAMVAYCVMIVAFPALMSKWPADLAMQAAAAAEFMQVTPQAGQVPLDALTGATPLDALRTGLLSGASSVSQILGDPAVFGLLAGRSWEWIALAYLLGGLWLVQQKIITWHIPVAFLGTLALISGVFWLVDSQHYASPLFHLMAGGSMLGAFFILTDPVSGATTPRGKLLFAAGAALITYLIRVFGNYPDGVAFATLLMNLCVPLIDMKTQPAVFGHKK